MGKIKNFKTLISFLYMNPYKSHNNSYMTGPETENFHNMLMQIPENGDRKNKIKQFKPIDEFLNAYHIPTSIKFSKILYYKKIITRTQQVEIIINLQTYIISHNKLENIFLTTRAIKKTNEDEKNMFLTFLALKYPVDCYNFIKDYLNTNYSNIAEKINQEIKENIEELHSSYKNNQIPELSSIDPSDFHDDSNEDHLDWDNFSNENYFQNDDENYYDEMSSFIFP